MTFTNFRHALILPLLFISQIASAGIIDTDRDSFIDDTTGLEWLDFNITAPHSFNYVTANLGQGQAYDGWRLATVNEAIQLVKSGFSDEATYLSEEPTRTIALEQSRINSQFEDQFDIMGYSYMSSRFNAAYAYFTDNQGDIARFYIQDIRATDSTNFDSAAVDYNRGDFFENRRELILGTSTLLVKGTSTATTTQVSEPASIFVFALGIMALGLRRFNKAKSI